MQQPEGNGQIKDDRHQVVGYFVFVRGFENVQVKHLGRTSQAKIKKNKAQKPYGQAEYVLWFHQRSNTTINGHSGLFKYFRTVLRNTKCVIERVICKGRFYRPAVYAAAGAGAGELVYWVRGKEASFPFVPDEPPVDATVVGIVDSVQVKRPKPARKK